MLIDDGKHEMFGGGGGVRWTNNLVKNGQVLFLNAVICE